MEVEVDAQLREPWEGPCVEGAADCDSALGLLDLLGRTQRVEPMLCRAMPHGLGAVVRADEVECRPSCRRG
jgi:hypothetical protein